MPPTPPREQWYAENDTAHWGNGSRVRIDEACKGAPKSKQVSCSLKAFKKKPFVVIAFVDSGINPYHQDFRAPEFNHHPSKYIEGYPKDAPALKLALDVADKKGYEAARKADALEWPKVQASKLQWFPGTRVIGGISIGAGGSGAFPEFPILDENGHGTGVASVAAGQYFGSNPNALIVMVEGLGGASLEWATSQKWIDIVSNSWGNIGNLPLGSAQTSKEATERGQTVAFASGNGASNTNSSTAFPADGPVEDPCKCKTPDSNPSLTSPYGGPSWVLTVGAVSPINGQAHWWHSIPVDVSSFGSKWRAAGAFGVKIQPKDEDNIETRDFGGTSCATPVTAGVLSAVIEAAREALNDNIAGQKADQVVAKAGPGAQKFAKGPLEDGKLTREEAETIVMKTAFPVAADPEKITWDYAVRPTTEAYFVYQGYGVVNRDSKALALKVLFGAEELADRAEVDQWLTVVDALRDAAWDR